MKVLKKITALVATLALTIGMASNCFAASWDYYFGLDSGWYEGAETAKDPVIKDDSWSVDLASIGWGGVWGAQMFKKVDLKKGTDYHIKCTLKSSKVNKWVFIKISTKEDFAYGKWVWLTKGKATTVDETFNATANADQITFGFGGEYGDRSEVDGTGHYAYASGGAEGIAAKQDADGDSVAATTISCSDFVLEEVSSGSSDDGDSTPSTTTTTTVKTGDFTPIACGTAAILAAAAIVVFARKRDAE